MLDCGLQPAKSLSGLEDLMTNGSKILPIDWAPFLLSSFLAEKDEEGMFAFSCSGVLKIQLAVICVCFAI